jgi:hypothetical protein
MRIVFTILFITATCLTAFSQFRQSQTTETAKLTDTNITAPNAVSYRLFPTTNIWTFIKLNTRNGQMWQVQFDVAGENRNVTYLNTLSLVSSEEEVNDRFTLYPTQNMYNFILLDQLSGKTWQVQWSQKAENRGVIPIE